MAYEVELPGPLKKQGWKIKIRDRERVEPPHVTILRRTKSWRWGLREQDFLDDFPEPVDVPFELVEILKKKETRRHCIEQWDQMYPDNPVSSRVNDDR